MTERFEAMWHNLVTRVELAKGAPVTDEGRRVLQWVMDEMDSVWNGYRKHDESKSSDLKAGC